MQDVEIIQQGTIACGGCGGAKHYKDIICPICGGTGEGTYPDPVFEEHYAPQIFAGEIDRESHHTFMTNCGKVAPYAIGVVAVSLWISTLSQVYKNFGVVAVTVIVFKLLVLSIGFRFIVKLVNKFSD